MADSTGGQQVLSWRRLLTCLGAGAVVGGVTAVTGAPGLALLLGWCVAAGGLLAWVWRACWPRDASATKQVAEEEGRTRSTDAAVLWATVISLGAVVEGLVRSGSSDAVGVAVVVLSVVVVVLSWGLVSTVFAFEYARRYYSGGDGGIDFGQKESPAYSDFAYAALGVGMSYAVPDVQITDTSLRKVALGHALLSYLFGTVLVAVAVSLITDLG
ncbi:DUF1345 domain-containing protein [Quadrisphaera sp. INWT6]|uniref:DUF1345 domain-containing protein n=1 Tax=Quadrisphaera sp. INWT6 TaxID=2596917 RepID=UPI0019D61A16|nr:DUF1345 domain-containing protein [Quadrisphaera sp. INWT6]